MALVVILLVVSACSAADIADTSPLSRLDGSPAQTDSLVYHLARTEGMYRAYVTATYTNGSGAPIYFVRCNSADPKPMYDVRRTGPDSSARLFIDSAFWACAGGVPNGALAPGASVTVRIPVGSYDQPNMSPPLEPEELIGTMRVIFSICKAHVSDSDHCVNAPESERQSNAFQVVY